MTKKSLSEADICDRYITPAIDGAGWKKSQVRREYSFTDGQMIVRGQLTTRGKRKRADYLLFYPQNQPIAVIEAKDNKHSLGGGDAAGSRICRDFTRSICVFFEWGWLFAP
ncbi:hypothetical protein [Acaryochloris sp. 'Moss Beach']|uniref:hypothetical protein n=1 Tax=Acaryochloris sp. 'Moss Beach' TaxID=2740837 RepID=UPI001F1F155B